ncbi:MAG: sugar ABC transporter substrate-binding protein [Acetivibrionales bacterium]|jgi:ABC-type sugar transport system substrate-binding protein
MKKTSVILIALLLVLCLFVGCTSGNKQTEGTGTTGQTDKTSSEGTAGEKPVKVMVLAKLLSDPYCTWLMDMTEKYLKEDYPDVEYTVLDQQGDPANTESFYDQAILEGYDVVIMQKVSGSQDTDALLQSYAEKGLRTVIINNQVDDGVSCSVFFPEFVMGNMIGNYAAEILPQNAKVCMIKSTPSLFSSEERSKGYLEALKSRPDVTILDTQNVENWNKDIAINVMSDWCQRFDQIDGILSMNDGMALGAIEAAKADNRDVGEMKFFGIDGLADGCLSIKAGELNATVLQDAAIMAKKGVEVAMQLVENPDMDPIKVELEPLLITEENVDEYIQMHRDNGVIK